MADAICLEALRSPLGRLVSESQLTVGQVRPSQPETIRSALRSLPAATWLRALPIAAVAALVIAIPSDLIDNRFFGRPVAPRPIDYVILAVTASLIGLVLAIRPPVSQATDAQERRTMWSGFVSFLAVGCPVCNQAVVALVGTSGALSWWAPVQPVVGIVAGALLVWTLRQRLRTYQLTACPI